MTSVKSWWRWTLQPCWPCLPLLNTKSTSMKLNAVSPSVFFTCHLSKGVLSHTRAFSTLWVHWRVSFPFLSEHCTPENCTFSFILSTTASSSFPANCTGNRLTNPSLVPHPPSELHTKRKWKWELYGCVHQLQPHTPTVERLFPQSVLHTRETNRNVACMLVCFHQ